MSEIKTNKLLTDSAITSYLDALRQQDVALEQIELILYKMHQLAQQSEVDDCSEELRQQLQTELEALLLNIDHIQPHS